MEPGADRRAVTTAWRRIEQRRHAGNLLAAGTALLLGGGLVLLLGITLPARLCAQGVGYRGCVTSSPSGAVRVSLLIGGGVAVGAGALAVQRALGAVR